MTDIAMIVLLVVFVLVAWPLVPAAARFLDRERKRQDALHEAHMESIELWKQSVDNTQAMERITFMVERAGRGKRYHKNDVARSELHGGFVYLMRLNNEWCKIGYATDVRARFTSIRGSTPYELVLVHVIATEHASRLEALLHERYASKRGNGEWFMLDEIDIAAICSIASPITLTDINRKAF